MYFFMFIYGLLMYKHTANMTKIFGLQNSVSIKNILLYELWPINYQSNNQCGVAGGWDGIGMGLGCSRCVSCKGEER